MILDDNAAADPRVTKVENQECTVFEHESDPTMSQTRRDQGGFVVIFDALALCITFCGAIPNQFRLSLICCVDATLRAGHGRPDLRTIVAAGEDSWFSELKIVKEHEESDGREYQLIAERDRSHLVPCIAVWFRSGFAFSALVPEGRSGDRLDSDDRSESAMTRCQVLPNNNVYEFCLMRLLVRVVDPLIHAMRRR